MKDINKLIKPSIRALRPYEVKEIPCSVKLDANESPYGFEDHIKNLKDIKTNRYPDPEAKELRKVVAKRWGISSDNILHGNGSDELIHYIVTTFGGPVLYPVPTFSMYGIISKALGEKTIEIPLAPEFDIDIKHMLQKIKRERPHLIFLSSPNNPTGNCFSSEAILRIIETSGAVVVVDEAYQPFASRKGFLPLFRDYQNLLIMRTLSKIGLASLRVGFLIGRQEIISEINKVRLPFNVNSYSQAVAIRILKEKGLIDGAIKKIVSERERLFSALSGIKGIEAFPSEANFILFRVRSPEKVYRSLLKKGILIRNLDSQVRGCLRVTVGTERENSLFLKALKDITYGGNI
ncbi:MAG: histidinol-phosphate transaminase [Thermodesulfovibrionales bacterium]